MRAKEFINEQAEGSLQVGAAKALPHAFTIPGLPNQNPYLQYRYGVAVASAGAQEQLAKEKSNSFHRESAWGDGMIVVNYDEKETAIMQKALHMMNAGPPKTISSKKSEEADDVGKVSPVRSVKGALK